MAYNNFTMENIETNFGIGNQMATLFEKKQIVVANPTDALQKNLEVAFDLPIRSKKAKSESIVYPILLELRQRNNKLFTIYSGDDLVVDQQHGLEGYCDYLLAKDMGSFSQQYPIFLTIEVTKNDLAMGVPTCAAQMLAIKLYNEMKGKATETVYGCVTTGSEWLFVRLSDKFYIDRKPYSLNQLEVLLGVFQLIIEPYKK